MSNKSSKKNRVGESTENRSEKPDNIKFQDQQASAKNDDTNENKKISAEFSITQYTDRLYNFVDNLDEAFLVVDANSRQILRVNKAASRLTGFTEQELLSFKIDNIHPPEELPLLLLEIQRLEFEKSTSIEDFTLVQKNHWKFPVDINLTRLVKEEENFLHKYFVAIYRGESKGNWEDTFSKRNRELITLMEVGQTIASALNLDEIIDLTMLKLASVCNAKFVSIFFKDEDDQIKIYKAHKNPPEDILLFDRPWRVGIEEGPHNLVDENKKILQVENVFIDDIYQKWRPIAERIGYGAVFSMAMVPRDVSIGIFNLYFEKPRKFSQEEINFLRTAVTYLSISIENARLYREYKEKADQLAAINEITKSINSSLDIERVIKTIAFEVKNIVDFDYISIVLFEEDSDNLQMFSLASQALGQKLQDKQWKQIEKSTLGWLQLSPELRTGAKLEKENYDFVYESKLLLENELKSKLNVLLLSKEKYLGAISVGKLESRAYNKTHQDIFQQIAGQMATALENAKLYQEAKRRLTEFSALADVSKSISSSLNIREVLDLIVKAAATAMHAKICTIWFVGEDVEPNQYSSNGDDVSLLQSSIREKLDQIVKRMQPLVIEDLENESINIPELPENLRATRLRSFVGVPVISRNKTIAVLSVYKEKNHRFDDREIKLLGTIANQAAIGIENAKLYEQERRRAAQLGMVNEVGKKITKTLDLNKLLNTVTKVIHEIFGHYHVAVYLVGVETGLITLKSQAGALGGQLEDGAKIENPDTPIARSVSSTETLLIQDLKEEKEIDRGYPHDGALLCIPLQVAKRINGTLVLFSDKKNSFDNRDLFAFEALASQVASVIENARLFEETKLNSEKLSQANSELENFVFTVSHDLKSPIVSVQGFSSILLNDYSEQLDQEAVHYLKRIQGNVTQMERLIKDLLELSRIGRVVNKSELTEINEVIQSVISDLQFQAADTDVKLIAPDDFPQIMCDRDRMFQVFTNLISNSIKYMGNKPNPMVEIGHREDENSYIFYVRDNGVGIDPNYHQKIFELFQSLKEVKDVEGTGIGLTIVKRIVDNHKGKIWVESEKGKGATFFFSIPK